MSAVKRVIIIVLDSMGVGELPDAAEYGDEGSNTLANTAKAVGGLSLPHMQELGLGNITSIEGVPPRDEALGAYGRMAEASAGKDTTTGHWEIAGIYSPQPLPTYPNGFPKELIEEYERRIGRKTLGNYPRSGTVIIQELGEEHVRTGYPIVYTSADSVFQVAAHEEVIPIQELYRICQIAREMLVGEHAVGRVIARPFIGEPGNFTRTERRKDFSILPPEPTLLDRLVAAGHSVMGVGKIEDIFAHRGLSQSVHSPNNMACIDQTLAYMKGSRGGLIFTNLVDFDMLWGHRNDPQGYASGLQDFDRRLPEIMDTMMAQDILFLTADHGNDPTTPSTDHSREYVPLLAYGNAVKPGVDLGTRAAELLGIESLPFGISFAEELLGE
jgi:phosphopentomutase